MWKVGAGDAGLTAAAGENAVVQRLPPRLLAAGQRRQPVVPNDVVRRLILISGDSSDHFRGRLAVVERLNRRLLDARGSVGSHRIAPALEIMRGRNDPLRSGGRLVHVLREINGVGDLLQVRFELEIGGRGEGRIPADNDQRVHLAVGHLTRKFLRARRSAAGSALMTGFRYVTTGPTLPSA